ncbi:alpha/beta hydrolase [Bradyrhizobium sp. I71]|uniref:alpha/beta fold hydrolase n=1 Tax=Bradyrhizobium sp. I71 TaxID=2590772 RepID=UPI001EF7F88A|nr:alpha/beta hydrolase [Bradyrhizobium sp. I71]
MDLRGYGETDKPPNGYDKRTMANDIVELLKTLGVEDAVDRRRQPSPFNLQRIAKLQLAERPLLIYMMVII